MWQLLPLQLSGEKGTVDRKQDDDDDDDDVSLINSFNSSSGNFFFTITEGAPAPPLPPQHPAPSALRGFHQCPRPTRKRKLTWRSLEKIPILNRKYIDSFMVEKFQLAMLVFRGDTTALVKISMTWKKHAKQKHKCTPRTSSGWWPQKLLWFLLFVTFSWFLVPEIWVMKQRSRMEEAGKHQLSHEKKTSYFPLYWLFVV